MSRLRLTALIANIALTVGFCGLCSTALARLPELYPTELCGPIEPRARILLLKSATGERIPVQLTPANPGAKRALENRSAVQGASLGCASGYLRPLLPDGQWILDAYEIRFDFDNKSGFGVGNL